MFNFSGWLSSENVAFRFVCDACVCLCVRHSINVFFCVVCVCVCVFQMGPEQIVLLLELLLEEERMSAGVLQTLERTYSLRMQDAEVAYVSPIDYIIL